MLNPINVIANYVVIQLSIIIFFIPFYVVYWHRNKHKIDKAISLSEKLELFFMSKQSNYLVLFWALGEALIWFVIPEFLLVLLVFMRIRRKRELLVYDIAGTAIGTLIALCLNLSNNVIMHLPFIRPRMVEQTVEWYNHSGVWGLLYQPFSGVPYKVFTLSAHNFDFFIVWFLLVAIAVRMSRYFVFFGVFSFIYPALHQFVYRNYVRLFFGATFVFTILLLRIVNNYS